ncbi:MAG: TonB-dependent receptor [Bacteroidia bacterium]
MFIKHFHIFLSILILSSYSSFAQQFKGKVVSEEDGSAIPFATVYFVELNTGVSCTENGYFEYNFQLPKTFKVKFSAIGYQSKTVYLKYPVEEELVITLKEAHINLNEVTVSTTTGILQKHSIANIETRSISELAVNLPTTLGEAISNIPSVYQTSTGPGISKPVIRGLSGMRIVTYLNGLRIENQQWGGDHGMGVSENGIGTVEIIKGPSSLLYGADALGGVVYFMDESYAGLNEVNLTAESRYESNTNGSINFLSAKINKNNLRINIHGNHTNHADYRLPNGQYAKFSAFSETNIKAALGYNYKNWVLNIRYNYLQNFVGLPGHTHDTIFTKEIFQRTEAQRNIRIPAQHINNHYSLVENTFYFKNSDLKIWLGNTSNRLTEFDEKVTIPGIDMHLNTSTYNVRYKQSISEKTYLISGFQGMYQFNENGSKASEKLLPNATLNDNGVYALLHTEIANWELQTGIRYDIRTINTKEFFKGNDKLFKQYQGFNYSIGASKISDIFQFRINASSGFRPPHLSELLSNGVHHGTLRFEIGDINLKSETSHQIDLSGEYISEHLRIIINPFYQRIFNFIYINPAGIRVDGLPLFYYKQANYAELMGGDIGWHYHPHFLHQLHIENNISYIYAQKDNGTALPLIPQTRFNSTLRFELNTKGLIQIENLSIQHLYFLEQNRVATYESASAAYQLFHASASFKINFKNPIYIRTGVKNIFNEVYIDHLSRLKNIGLEHPGRNIFVSLKMNINYKL